MSGILKPLLGMAAAFLLGALAWWLVGPGPDRAASRPGLHVDWQLPDVEKQELAAADAVWKQRAPWGSQAGATGAGEAEPAPPPPSTPVGVVAAGKGFRAVFVTPGADEVQVKAGDRLPDGGRVIAVSRFRIGWIDAQGTKHEQELLSDPLLSVPTASSPMKKADGRPSAGAFSRR